MFKFIKKIRYLTKSSPLSKLKVFYQILIIIVIMVIFLGIQGYTDIQVMNNLQETTQIIYNETANKLNEISQLKLDLEQLRIYYTETAAKFGGSDGDASQSMEQRTGKLAEQSRKAAMLIEDMIGQMKDSTGEAVKIMIQSIKRVELGKELVNEAADTFEKIFYELNSNLAEIEAVASSAQQMAKKNQSVIDAISMIAAISEQSLASTEEVSTTAEEQSASMQELTALAENLAHIAENLQRSIARFTLEKGPNDLSH